VLTGLQQQENGMKAHSAVVGTALLISGVLSGAAAQSPRPPAATPPSVASSQAPLSDAEFVKKATIGNRFEIAAGELAAANGGDAKVKAFGRMMTTDHAKALKELEAASQGINAGVPPQPALDLERQTKLDTLKAKKGAEFDAAYKADMKKAHDDTLAMLKAYQKSGTSEKLKAWATATLPTVQTHRDAIYAM
jgi:putative membrane protein